MTVREFYQKWIAALRSGNYAQGFCKLRSKDDCFCVLGVACDVINPKGWVLVSERLYGFRFNGSVYGGFLPQRFHDEIGVCDRAMMYLNDAGRLTFEQLADRVEEVVSQFDDKTLDRELNFV